MKVSPEYKGEEGYEDLGPMWKSWTWKQRTYLLQAAHALFFFAEATDYQPAKFVDTLTTAITKITPLPYPYAEPLARRLLKKMLEEDWTFVGSHRSRESFTKWMVVDHCFDPEQLIKELEK